MASTEIAHILFMDIVGYSRHFIEEQERQTYALHTIVRATAEFHRAENHGELIRLDTGDGMALVFFRDPLAPVKCAVEIARALPAHPALQLRTGINSGPITRRSGINDRENVLGGGINMAQRVMDCGDAGHILLSKTTAEFLGNYEEWASWLTELGTCQVKHGVCMHLYNFCKSAVGNSALPQKFSASCSAPPDQRTNSHLPHPPPASRPSGHRVENRAWLSHPIAELCEIIRRIESGNSASETSAALLAWKQRTAPGLSEAERKAFYNIRADPGLKSLNPRLLQEARRCLDYLRNVEPGTK